MDRRQRESPYLRRAVGAHGSNRSLQSGNSGRYTPDSDPSGPLSYAGSRGYYDEYYADKKHTPDPFGRLDDLSSRAYSPAFKQGMEFSSDSDAGPKMGQGGEQTEEEKEAIDAYMAYIENERDERDRIQKKTFTKWCNQHLRKSGSTIDDLYEDFRDGFKLLTLLEILSGTPLGGACSQAKPKMHPMLMAREKGKNRFHRLQNVRVALEFLKKRKVRLVNIRAEDIVDGNPKLILGLVWSIILHFQVEEIVIEGDDSDQRLTAKKALLQWAKQNMEGYDVSMTNFTNSWRDGTAFNVIIHRNKPEIIDMTKLADMTNRERLQNAFTAAEKKFGIEQLIDPEDVDVDKPDERSIITYVSSLYDVFPKVPPKPTVIQVEEWEEVIIEYRRIFTEIIEWCTETITIIRKKKAPRRYEDAVTLMDEYNILVKDMAEWEIKKTDCKDLYLQLLTLASRSRGEFSVPNELDFCRVEAVWGDLEGQMRAHQEYLQNELDRLERLGRIAAEIQQKADTTDGHLTEAEDWLVKLGSDDLSDIPLDVNPVECCINQLDAAEKIIKKMFELVQELRTGKYFEADQIYEMVFALHERFLQDKNEFDRLKRLGLLDPLSIKERRKLRPPLHESKEWNDLIAAEQFLENSKQKLSGIQAGADSADCSRMLAAIDELAAKFDAFYGPKCRVLDDYYGNFDEGSKDYKMYDDRYKKFKVEAELHRGSLNRRKAEQGKLIDFMSECDERSDAIGRLIKRLTSDDWSDENKDVIGAKLELDEMTRSVNFEISNIEKVLSQGPKIHSQVEMGKELINSKTAQLQEDKNLATILLEAVQVQIKLLEQHQDFYKELNLVKTDLESSREKTNSLVTDMNLTNVQNRSDQLQKIKITFSSINTKINGLEGKAKTVSNIKARRYRTEAHFAARCVTRFKSATVNLARNEQLTLTASVNPEAWECQTDSGHGVTLPAAVVVLPPPNKDAIDAADLLKQGYNGLEKDHDRVKANCDFFNTSNRFVKAAGLILEWDRLPSIQTRSSAISNLEGSHAEAGRFVDPSQNPIVNGDYGQMAGKIDECHAHIEALARKEAANREAEAERLRQQKMEEERARQVQGLRDYFNELELKLGDARNQILQRVSIAIQFESPQSAAHDAQKCLNDLEAIRAGATRLQGDLSALLILKPTPPGSFELNQDLKKLSEKIDFLQGLSQLYIKKVQKVQIVIGQVQATENIISRLEDKIQKQLAEPASTSDEYETKLRILKNTSFELEAQDSLIDSLTESAKEAKALGQSVENESERPDPDQYIYNVMVNQLKDRINQLKNQLNAEKANIESEIPKLKNQEGATDSGNRILSDSDRLLKELQHIKESADKELRREHEDDFDIKTSEQRVEDYSKRLMTVDSPVAQTISSIRQQINDPSLIDEDLKSRLQKAADSLEATQGAAQSTVEAIAKKMKHLRAANDGLKETEKILQRYREGIENNGMANGIDELEHRHAILSDLINDIPYNDPKFEGLRNLLQGLVDHDSDRNRVSNEIMRHQSEWGDLKWQLNLALESNKKDMERKKAEQDHQAAADACQVEIGEFIDLLNSISENQVKILGEEHEFISSNILIEREKQQDILNRFNTQLEPRFKDLIGRCKKLGLTGEETALNGAFERVYFLTKAAIDKINAIKNFSERIEAVDSILGKWTIEAERFERDANSTDVDFLNQLAKEAQKAYAATAEDDHAVFELPQFAAKIAAAHVQVIREAADKDGVNANGLSDEKMKQWQAIKQRIQVAGKQALANAKTQLALQQGNEAKDKMNFGSSLKDRLLQLQNKVNQRIATETPLDVNQLLRFKNENEVITNEIRSIKIETEKYSTTTMDFLRKSRDLTTEHQNHLRGEIEDMTNLSTEIESIWALYLDKMARISNCCDKYDQAKGPLVDIEHTLARIDVISKSEAERDSKINQLRALQGRFSQIDSLFFALESSHQEYRGTEGRLKQKGYHDPGSEKLSVNVTDLINRWKRCKNEIGRRQTEIKEAFDRLGRFKKNLDKHVSFLDNTEAEFNQIANTEAETTDAIQRKIDSIEQIKNDVNAKQQDFETIKQNGSDLNDYIREANDKIAEWSSGCDQTISLGTLEEFVEIELQEVQRRYDQFGNLIDETIRNLNIKLKVTKDKEDETRRLEMEEEIIQKSRNPDIKFQSQFGGDATLQSLENAGLITGDQADRIEMGELDQHELDLQLKPWLFCGEEPIVGIILEETGEKISICEAGQRNLLRKGTTLELLEAQAAVGFIVEPQTGEKLSVEEAVQRRLVDNYQIDALKRAMRAVTGWPDARDGKLLSIFEAMKRGLIADTRVIRLLEAQIATGGIIDPRQHHRVPINIAFRRGLFNKELNDKLEDTTDDTKGFFDPNTQENLTYLELIRRCQKEPDTGFHFLVLRQKRRREGRASRSSLWTPSHNYNQSNAAQQVKTPEAIVKSHESSGKPTPTKSTEQTQKSKSPKSKSGSRSNSRSSSANREIRIEVKPQAISVNKVSFKSTTGEASLKDLIDGNCIDSGSIQDLQRGLISLNQLEDKMSDFLVGKPVISGVIIKHGDLEEVITITEAQLRGYLAYDTAAMLLEAQAATGGICSVINSNRYGLREAFEMGLIERDVIPDLELGYNAILGFPSKNGAMTIMEACRLEKISEQDAVRMLHVQVATGGIYNPTKHHRLPLKTATERCLWKSEWNSVNTKFYSFENTTYSYSNLMENKCQYDSASGGLLLKIKGKSTKSKKPVKELEFKDISIEVLKETGILSNSTYAAAKAGYLSSSDIESHLRRRLIGCEPIGGVSLDGKFFTLWDASAQGIIPSAIANELMEAQVAATGALLDAANQKLTIDKAERSGVIEPPTADNLRKFLISHQGKTPRDAIKKDLAGNSMVASRTLRMLEVQLACGGIVDPATGLYFPVETACTAGLITEELLGKIRNLKAFHNIENDLRLTYLDLCLRCRRDDSDRLSLPIKTRKNTSRRPSAPTGQEMKLSTGGGSRGKDKVRRRKIVVEHPDTKEEMSVKEAFQRELLTKDDTIELLKQEGKSEEKIRQIIQSKSCKTITTHATSSSSSAHATSTHTEKHVTSTHGTSIHVEHSTFSPNDSRSDIFSMSSSMSLPISVSQSSQGSRCNTPSLNAVSAAELESRLRQLATEGARAPICAIRDESNGDIITISEAERRRLIDGLTEQRLLEAQAATGGIIDPNSRERISPSEAASRKIINSRLISSLNEAQKAYSGFFDRRTRSNTQSLPEALRSGTGSYDMLTRLLEMQIVLGGIIDTQSKRRLSLQEAIDKNWIDSRKAERVADFNKHNRQLVDPLTNMNTTYAALLDQSVIEDSLTILPALPRTNRSLKHTSGLIVRASSLASSRASSRGGSPPPEMRITRNVGQF